MANPRALLCHSLSDLVFRSLVAAILDGTYPVGQNLPAERKLVETFGVNRHVIREALKRLSQAGLLKISHGGGALVLDFRQSAGLDLLTLITEHAGLSQVAEQAGLSQEGTLVCLSVAQMRCAVAVDAARLCAEKANAELKAEIVAITRQMGTTTDEDALFDLELELWRLVMQGANNLAYRLAYNTVINGVRAKGVYTQARALLCYELKMSGCRRPIAEAIASGDGELAARCTREGMRWANEVLERRMEAANQNDRHEPERGDATESEARVAESSEFRRRRRTTASSRPSF